MILSSQLYSNESIYDINLKDINGKKINLNDFKGKYILFVNVASKCGFTKQYTSLEKLSKVYKDDLVVIGFPCNQFGGQEPGTASQIQEFCSNNFNITFILTEKIDVKGKDQHPIYNWLTNKSYNGKMDSVVKWNFQKYIVNRDGELINYFYSITTPLSAKITDLIL